MDSGTILQLIGSYGFPIVACILMGWFVKYTTDLNREQINELSTEQSEALKGITEALNNNTIALTKLCEKMEV